jgi:serine/threonine-protein kinase
VSGVLLGKYQLEQSIGEGGQGAVYRARHLGLDQPVAIKLLSSEACSDSNLVARFLREARIQALLKSPHVCQVFDVDKLPDGRPFMVLEFLEGKTLDKLVRETPAPPWTERVQWIIEACEGLAAAHEAGLVHRDIKPANLIRAKVGSQHLVKVLDFGIAKLDDGVDLTGDAAIGTLRYMAPEQVLDSRAVQPASDLWAMGITLYRLLTGRLPFPGEDTATYVQSVLRDTPVPLRQVMPEAPAALEAALVEVLQKDPAKRPASARAWAHRLRRLVPGESAVEVKSPSGLTEVVPARGRSPARLLLVGAGGLMAALAVGLFAVRGMPDAAPPATPARSQQTSPRDVEPSPAPAPDKGAPPAAIPSEPELRPVPVSPPAATETHPSPATERTAEAPAPDPDPAPPATPARTPTSRPRPVTPRAPTKPVVPADENPDHL